MEQNHICRRRAACHRMNGKGKRMKRITTLGLLLVLLAAPASAETVSRVAAIVKDEVITTFQLERALAADPAAHNLEELSAADLARLKSQTLDRLIDEKLFLQRVAELGLTVKEAELEAAIDDIQAQNNLSRAQLIAALQQQGMDFASYRNNLKLELLRYRLIGREVNSRVEVTNREVRDYFRAHIDDYRVEPTVHLQRISIDLPDDATPQQQTAIRELAAAIRDKLTVDQQPFAAVLASLGTVGDGADMGALEERALLPEFQQALQGLEIGAVSEPVAAAGQLHLLLVVDRNPGDNRLFDKVRDEIVEILRKDNTEKRFVEWSRELRDQAHIKILL